MSLAFKPMLAASTIPALEDINYPVLASPKLDGIRCVMGDGIPFSRNMKRIPNKFVQEELQKLRLHGLDGELMIKNSDSDFNSVQSGIMSHSGEPDFEYWVFDSFIQESHPFKQRTTSAQFLVQACDSNRVKYVQHFWITNEKEMSNYLDSCIAAGYEGAIIRDPEAKYKQGRSTPKQGWMSKLKKFYDDEAEIIGYTELFHNTDTSSKKLENMVPGNMLGSFKVKWKDKVFDIGSGFTEAERIRFWQDRDTFLGDLITFKYQEVSKYGIPRFPVAKGFRNKGDLS